MEQQFSQDSTPMNTAPEDNSSSPVLPASVTNRAKERRGASMFQPILSGIQQSSSFLTTLWGPLYHNTTIFERIGFVLAALVIVLTFFPWVSIKDIVITGWNSFLYPIALPITIASLLCMAHIIWSSLGRERPKWFPESHQIYMLLGVEILQLGLITYALLSMYGITFSATTIHDLSFAPMLITFCGVGFIAIGLFEWNMTQQKKGQTIVHPSTYTKEPEETHELNRILEQQEQEELRN